MQHLMHVCNTTDIFVPSYFTVSGGYDHVESIGRAETVLAPCGHHVFIMAGGG